MDSAGERGAVGQAMVVGEEVGAEVLGKDDVKSVSRRHVVPVGPSGADERCHRGTVQVLVEQATDRNGCLRLGDPVDQELAPQHSEHLGVEVLGDPAFDIGR